MVVQRHERAGDYEVEHPLERHGYRCGVTADCVREEFGDVYPAYRPPAEHKRGAVDHDARYRHPGRQRHHIAQGHRNSAHRHTHGAADKQRLAANLLYREHRHQSKGDDDDIGGDNTDINKNILLGKKATASTENGGNVAKNAIDSDEETRWESQHGKEDPEWLQVDLGDTYEISGFKIIWETASAKEYKIQVSNDGKEWEDIYEVDNGKEGETRKGTFDESIKAKYIRILGISKTLEIYGYSIYDLQIYGKKVDADVILRNKTNCNRILENVKCHGCGKDPFLIGCRFKCAVCENLDFCEKCEKKFSGKHNHPFLKIYEPKMTPVFFKCLTKK